MGILNGFYTQKGRIIPPLFLASSFLAHSFGNSDVDCIGQDCYTGHVSIGEVQVFWELETL